MLMNWPIKLWWCGDVNACVKYYTKPNCKHESVKDDILELNIICTSILLFNSMFILFSVGPRAHEQDN